MIETILAGLVTAIAAIIVAWATARATVSGKKIEAEATPYSELSARITEIEAQIRLLHREQFEDRAYMRRILLAWPSGRPLPSPIPGWLIEHLPSGVFFSPSPPPPPLEEEDH